MTRPKRTAKERLLSPRAAVAILRSVLRKRDGMSTQDDRYKPLVEMFRAAVLNAGKRPRGKR